MFDGGVLTSTRVAAIRLQEKEIAAYRFVAPEEFPDGLPGVLKRRLATALAARRSGTTTYLENGYLPS